MIYGRSDREFLIMFTIWHVLIVIKCLFYNYYNKEYDFSFSFKETVCNYQFIDDNIQPFLNEVFYFAARPINGIYELNIDDSSNNKSIIIFEPNISMALPPWSYKQQTYIQTPKEWTYGGK
uniref:Uncharacterized protein n=1 Tax=Lactuca sativa TaxID=4236 RepID=A0A9R1XG55_LACSA|nr:hypothetical protein LSAT_V11C400204140 [Lactuca sativa]